MADIVAMALEIYEALKSAGVADAKAKSAAEKFDEALESRLGHEWRHLATREDLEKLRTEIHAVRTELIKWMFIFWVGQVATITGILFAFFKS
ncbi:MAG: hypothetical protein HYY13_02445 [Nitrospirae bacterium]|nr:hypothetical protein [Nitrospirota bacterium]